MAESINTVALTGRLTREAELRYTNTGTPICSFSVANNYRRKQGNEWAEEANFFDCTLFGKRGESIKQYLQKGTQVAITGQLRQERWEKDGQNRSKVKVLVDNIELLGGGKSSGQQSQQSGQESFEDDVPF